MKREITIVYTIEDEAAYQAAGNPFNWALHHGLKAHTLSVGDQVECANEMEAALEEISGLGFSGNRAQEIAQAALDAEHARTKEALSRPTT